jgi:hypothetical protein
MNKHSFRENGSVGKSKKQEREGGRVFNRKEKSKIKVRWRV